MSGGPDFASMNIDEILKQMRGFGFDFGERRQQRRQVDGEV